MNFTLDQLLIMAVGLFGLIGLIGVMLMGLVTLLRSSRSTVETDDDGEEIPPLYLPANPGVGGVEGELLRQTLQGQRGNTGQDT